MANGRAHELFALPVQHAYLLFHPLTRVSALVNARALELLRQWLNGAISAAHLPEHLAELARLMSETGAAQPDDLQRPFKPQFLGLIPTRSCNASCRYCDFGSGRSRHAVMPLGMASAAAAWWAEFLKNSGQTGMEIHFFGGEPFTARRVVETTVHRGRALAASNGLALHLEVSTNGVFEPKYAQFVGDYFDAVVLSLDGLREAHDFHRPLNAQQGTFETVRRNARLLSKTPTELCLRCCISQANVNQMETIAEWFCREFQPAAINFETLTPNPETLATGLYPPDPYFFAQQAYGTMQIIREYGIQAVYAAAESEPMQPNFCPVGHDTLIIAPDGLISSCYLPRSTWRNRGLNMAVGRINAFGRVEIDHAAIMRLRRMVTDKPRCINCFCRFTCAGGCHVSHTHPKSARRYGDFCIQTRLLTACKLLDEMGQEAAARGLLSDKDAMRKMALQSSDRIEATV